MAEGEAYGNRYHRAPREEDKVNKRVMKDPIVPKRAQSAFAFFARDNFHTVSMKKPDATSSLTAILGHIWTGLSSADKAQYEQMAVEDKARYEREMAEFLEKAKI